MSAPAQNRRVVVTGLGAVSPLGQGIPENWKNALEGKSGIDRISQFDLTDCPVTIAGEVRNFDVSKPVGPFQPFAGDPSVTEPAHPLTQAANAKEARKMGRFIHLALAAGLEAYADSGLDAVRPRLNPERMGCNIGVGMGGLPEIGDVYDTLITKGYKRITPFFIPQVIPNLAAGHLSMLLNLKGPNLCNVTACSSSAHSIGESFKLIQRGDADLMVTGGAEAVICKLGIGGFAVMRALSTRNDEPTRASRPFDVARDGFVMGEGGAVMILEELEHAKKRGARIYGEILGYGASGDAYHMTTPAPEGEGGRRAMAMALKDSGLKPEQIGYINAHGTSTPAGDAEEARAIRRLFPNGPSHLHVSSTKSMTGHLLGAAGGVEAVFTALALHEQIAPPTINLVNQDPQCDLDYVPNTARKMPIKIAVSNSFGFGGTNGTLVLRTV